jgi:hypothetical protein
VVNDGGTTKKITITNATSASLPKAGGTMTGALNVQHAASAVAKFQSTATNGGYVTYVGGSTTYIGAPLSFLGTGTASDFGIIGTGANNFVLGTSSAEKMRIDSAGNVGIGTSDITKDLQVAFSDSTTTNLNSGAGVLINNTNNGTGTLAPLLFSTDSGTRVRSAIAHVDTGGYGKGDLAFYTMSDGDNGGSTIDTSDERMRINADGIVTKPLQPSFGARGLSNAQSGGGTSGTNHTLVFSSATNNTGNHYSTSTGLFTAPVAGRYFVTFSGLYNASNNSTGPVYLMRNGSEKYRAYHDNSGTNYEQISVSGIMDVSANDTISVYSVIAGWHTGAETSFSGFLIG